MLVITVIAACERRKTPAEATAELCAELAELATYMEQHPLTSTTTVAEAQDIRAHVAGNVKDIREEAGQVQKARVHALEEASKQLEERVDRLPPNLPIGAAADSIRSEVNAVAAARASLNSDVQCVVQAGHQ